MILAYYIVVCTVLAQELNDVFSNIRIQDDIPYTPIMCIDYKHVILILKKKPLKR